MSSWFECLFRLGEVTLVNRIAPWFRRDTCQTRRLIFAVFVLGFLAPGCIHNRSKASLAEIYNPIAQRPDYERNPVIVIPGVMGSRLVDNETGATVWGEYGLFRSRRRTADDLATIAHPMGFGKPLNQLQDTVRSDGTLAYLELKIGGIPLELQAYDEILKTLGVGGYHDPDHPNSNEVNYGQNHFTCFQFDYDWRRDVAENAALLDQFIEQRRQYVQSEYKKRYGIVNPDIKFDIVAHSLGGLVSRYYLRYGSQQLPEDGSLPVLNWSGAKNIDRMVVVGTPNAGAASALQNLVDGYQLSHILPYYPPAVLGTMPALYQLLPRPHHHTLVDASRPEHPLDFYDPKLWRKMQWGIASPDQDEVLQKLLPAVPDRKSRQRIALDHQGKCLRQAQQLHLALDIPATPPPGTTLHLYAGDATDTPSVMSVDTQTGKLKVACRAPGDDTTTRRSALMKDQPIHVATTRAASPISWTSVTFLHASHLKLTSDPLFTDNVLALLLDQPR